MESEHGIEVPTIYNKWNILQFYKYIEMKYRIPFYKIN
jgi:hypothetical protein